MRHGLLALLTLALLVAPAQAGNVSSWVEKVHEASEWGDSEVVWRLLQEPTFEQAMHDEEALFTFCTTLSNCWRILAVRGGERVDEIHARVEPYVRARLSNDPLEAGDIYCWACVVSAMERTRRARGEKPDLERWQDAVRLGLTAANAASDRRDIAMEQIRWCGELAAFKKADAEFFLAQADALQKRLLEEDSPDWRAISSIALLHENKARAWAVRGKKRDALEWIEKGIAFVESHLDADPAIEDPYSQVPRARCNLITTARELHLRCKACYRIKEAASKAGLLTARLPDSGSWKPVVPDGEQDILTIAQFGHEGKSIRTIRIRALKHGLHYDMDGTGSAVLAENPKKIAEHSRNGMMWAMDSVSKTGKIRKGRHASGWPSGYHFTLEGLNEKGVWIRHSAVAVRSRKLERTFLFQVAEWEDSEEGLEEFEFVLTSLHPPR